MQLFVFQGVINPVFLNLFHVATHWNVVQYLMAYQIVYNRPSPTADFNHPRFYICVHFCQLLYLVFVFTIFSFVYTKENRWFPQQEIHMYWRIVVMASETSFLASKSLFRCILLWHFCISCLMYPLFYRDMQFDRIQTYFWRALGAVRRVLRR
jgi:hypothetical protein